MSQFHALAAAKQPTKPLSMAVVPEFSHVVILSNVHPSVEFAGVSKETSCCIQIQLGTQTFWLPARSKMLRKTF